MKKHVIAYMVLHMINQHCPLNAAAAQPSIIHLLQKCDKQAFSIAQQIPQSGKYIGNVARLMQHGREIILNSSRSEHPTIAFNPQNPELENDFKNLQHDVNILLPRYLLQDSITTPGEQSQRLSEVAIFLHNSNMQEQYKKPNVPWFPLLTVYQEKLERELAPVDDCVIN